MACFNPFLRDLMIIVASDSDKTYVSENQSFLISAYSKATATQGPSIHSYRLYAIAKKHRAFLAIVKFIFMNRLKIYGIQISCPEPRVMKNDHDRCHQFDMITDTSFSV